MTLPPPAGQVLLLEALQPGVRPGTNLALAGDCRQLADLADTFEVVPELMASWDGETLGRIRSILREYQASHPDAGYDHVSLLDVDAPAMT